MSPTTHTSCGGKRCSLVPGHLCRTLNFCLFCLFKPSHLQEGPHSLLRSGSPGLRCILSHRLAALLGISKDSLPTKNSKDFTFRESTVTKPLLSDTKRVPVFKKVIPWSNKILLHACPNHSDCITACPNRGRGGSEFLILSAGVGVFSGRVGEASHEALVKPCGPFLENIRSTSPTLEHFCSIRGRHW